MRDTILWGLILLVLAISFLNPGGWFTAGLIILVILVIRYVVPYLAQLVESRQMGASGAAKYEWSRGGGRK